MVFPVIQLSRTQRSVLALLASLAHAVCVCIAFTCAVYSSFIAIEFMKGLSQLMYYRNVVGYIPIAIAVLFFFVGSLHLHGAFVFAEQRYPVTRWQPNSIAEVKFLFGISSLCTLFATAACCFFFVMLDTHLSHGIIQGMVSYTTDVRDAQRINWMQRTFHCCAINGYKDWWDMSDIDLHGAETEVDLKNLTFRHCVREQVGCYLPHTCCKLNQTTCFPLIFNSNLTTDEHIAHQRAEQWFYSKGCVEAVKESFRMELFLALCFICVVVDGASLICTRLSSSSFYVLGVIGADDDERLPAWIFSFAGPSIEEVLKHVGEEEEGLEDMEKGDGEEEAVEGVEEGGIESGGDRRSSKESGEARPDALAENVQAAMEGITKSPNP